MVRLPGQSWMRWARARTPAALHAGVEEVLAVVEQATGMTRERLASRVQDRATVAARELLAVVAVHRCGARVAEVGRCFGKPADTVSRWLSRATDLANQPLRQTIPPQGVGVTSRGQLSVGLASERQSVRP